jgi:hypothetical protein
MDIDPELPDAVQNTSPKRIKPTENPIAKSPIRQGSQSPSRPVGQSKQPTTDTSPKEVQPQTLASVPESKIATSTVKQRSPQRSGSPKKQFTDSEPAKRNPLLGVNGSPNKNADSKVSPEDPFQFFSFPDHRANSPIKETSVPTNEINMEKKAKSPGVSITLKDQTLLFEQQAQRFEIQLVKLTKESNSLSQQLQEKDLACKKYEIELVKLKKDVMERDAKLQEKEKKLQETISSGFTFDQEKQSMANSLLSKQQEIHRLSEELTYAQTQIGGLRDENRSQKDLITELQSNEMHSSSVLNSKTQELLQANKSIEWLNQELGMKTNQLAEYRKEKTEYISGLQSKHEDLLQEKSGLEVRNQLLQKRADDLEQKLADKMDQLREVTNI